MFIPFISFVSSLIMAAVTPAKVSDIETNSVNGVRDQTSNGYLRQDFFHQQIAI
jgi:hypothetical protein